MGFNALRECHLTDRELDRLVGCAKGSYIQLRNEYHVLTSVNPLRLHPIWDIWYPGE